MLVAGLVASPLALGFSSAPASAASTTVVINEVYVNGGSANATYRSKYVELRNLTSSPVNLSGMSVQYRAPGSSGNSSSAAALTGTIPANGYYVVVGGSNGSVGADVPASPGQTSTGINPGAAGGTLTLVQGTTAVDPATSTSVVDKVGYGTSNTPEGTAASGNSVTQSLGRVGASTDTDANATDFGAQAPTPGASNGGGTDPGGQLAATSPGNQTGVVGNAFSLTLAATGGQTPYTWTTSPLPAGLTLNGNTVSGTPTAAGTTSVTATVTDGASATAQTTFTITVTAPGATLSIADVQGTGDVTPYAGQQVTTEGVVTAAYPAGGLNGFYLQTGGPDTTPDASDGIFVYGGTTGFGTSTPAVGASVRVTGTANEFNTVTQITATAAGISPLATPLPAPVFKTTIPGADCSLGSCPTTAEINAAREKVESEAFLPTADYTVTDVYDGSAYTGGAVSSAMFGEIGLAAHSDVPLFTPTDVVDAQDTAGIAARVAYNNAHRILLDDGSTLNYATAANTGSPFPYFTADHTVRVGANLDFAQPQVLTYSFNAWRLQPQAQVTGVPAGVTIEQDRPAAPAEVDGDVKLATFNVLNYFPTLGATYTGGTCTRYNDRQGNPVTVNQCPGNGPRGAWDAANFQRQQAKIVDSINKLDADVVTLEEIENSRTVTGAGGNRDAAVSTLVNALNAAAGGTTPRWAFVPSPAQLPAASEEDVIRNAIIYDPSTVQLVGESQILIGSAPFSNAREPFAQVFKATGDADADGFAVIVNHFKSKGSGTDDGTGQGAANPDRINQANALVAFADSFSTSRGVEKVFLTGDFNAYSFEDPVQAIEAAGYTNLDATTDPNKRSYNFDGQVGSLDHVFANEAAAAAVSGVDVWTTNGYESVYYEYSRFNYNVTNLYAPGPYRASDHNPEIVGINTGDAPEETANINLLNINDFHGRIDANTTRFATTIETLRAAEGEANSLFLSAGDNIGASLFASSVDDDDPTLDVLDALDLSTSAVGNHEFDQGFSDLQNDVKPDIDFTYLGANVYTKGTTTPALQEYDTFEVDGVTVGVIGVVTQETPSLVSPAGVAGLDFGDPIAAVNRVAAQLSDGNDANGEADIIVAEYHEGAGASLPDTATCAQEIAADTTFGRIARTTSASVDVIFTGHTHKEYACDGSVPGSDKTRPILQTGSYGDKIGQVVLTVDRASGDVTAYTQRNVTRSTTENLDFPRVAAVKQITDAALANAAAVGNQPVATITRDITTAYTGGTYVNGRYTGGTRDDRSSESTLGSLVANALRDGVSAFATPDLGVTNPGGLRSELLFAGNTTSNPANTDGVVTFAEANGVLPFNNTVAVVQLTGTQLKAVLEQQWQTNPDGTTASRPYLQLGLSDNVRVTADPTKAAGERITSVFINDTPLDLGRTYTVSTLSFLATGGDNFRAFTQGRSVDTGLLDAQMWRDYLADNSPVTPDFAREQVFESGKPASITAGERAQFQLGLGATTAPVQPLNPKTLNLTSQGSPVNTEVVAKVGEVTVGTFPVTDGIAQIDLTVPASVRGGDYVVFTATPSLTTVTVPFTPVAVATTVTGTAADVVYGTAGSVDVTVTAASGTDKPTGTVELRKGETLLGTGTLAEGATTIAIDAKALEVGDHTLALSYVGSTEFAPSTGTVDITVVKQTPLIGANATPTRVEVQKNANRVTVAVRAVGYVPTGTVQVKLGATVVDTATLDALGNAVFTVGPYPTTGFYPLTVTYLGDTHTETISQSVTVQVVKQAPVIQIGAPATVKKNARPTVTVVVSATRVAATGQVRFQYNGKTVTRALSGGKVKPQLDKLPRNTTVRATYLGNANLATATKTVTIRVR